MLVPNSISERSEVRVSLVICRNVSSRSRPITFMLSLCARLYVTINLSHGAFFHRAQSLLRAYCIGGHFVSGIFFSRWLFDWGAFDPVSFVQGLLAGDFRPITAIVYGVMLSSYVRINSKQ